MRKTVFGLIGLAVLLGGLLIAGSAKDASAEVSVSINLGPPPIVVAEPPEMVLVPRTQVYFVPGEIDVFFYGGYWWSSRGDRWYRARAYNGPWGFVERRVVPSNVRGVPKDYRQRYGRERHIPYGQWKKDPRHHQMKEERRERKESHKEMSRHEKMRDKERKGHEKEMRGHKKGKKGEEKDRQGNERGHDRN